ncbi:hypothetical protein P171DRAFT_478240 [Karstenula rhodostoma CBS 690.94]|uniref:Uncharacterized protein n=1 Tax=Karstenula rhodostoma CBS 690.94 TaxID=1392251 RepID=A0A9P4PVW3_9PLEO|nr:hypothetical protein P171DRAFT_478240 [Karstenula rhodostoma CBS 690.94]
MPLLSESSLSSDPSFFALSLAGYDILNELVHRISEPGPDGTIIVPIKKGIDEPMVPQVIGLEPYNNNSAYVVKIEPAMAADHLDSPDTMVDDAATASCDQESNMPDDSLVKLSTTEYGGLIFSDSKANILCANFYIKATSLKIEATVRVLPKQMLAKERFFVRVAFTTTHSSENSLLYNMRMTSAGSGSSNRATHSPNLKEVTAPGLVTVSPKFLYGLGWTYDTTMAVDIQAGTVF